MHSIALFLEISALPETAFVCVNKYHYICVYVFVYVHVCIYICMYAYTCLVLCRCMYIYIYPPYLYLHLYPYLYLVHPLRRMIHTLTIAFILGSWE